MKYDDIYDITEDGDVVNVITGRILKPQIRGPYRTITLHRLGHPTHYQGLLHRLVAQVWISNPENKPQVDHIDRDKLNNAVSNLRWATPSENQLNKPFDLVPRAHNTSGHLHIVIVQRKEDIVYRVQIRRVAHYSTHMTLEEAIEVRDAVMAGL
jgi:hypothetical protein